MSLITQPVTLNYIVQSLITILTKEEEILKKGVTPNTGIFLKYKNKNYKILEGNGFKYFFAYNFDLKDFLDSTNIQRAEVMSHDQISLNFGANLMYLYGYRHQGHTRIPVYKTATIGSLYHAGSRHSIQHPNGITLREYMQTVIHQLPKIVQKCPDITDAQDYYPQSYICDYTYTDLMGNETIKTATFTAIKYTCRGKKKVFFFGTGLQEFIVNQM